MKLNKVIIAAFCSLFSVSMFAEEELVKFGNFDSWITRTIKESALVGGKTQTLYEIGPKGTLAMPVIRRFKDMEKAQKAGIDMSKFNCQNVETIHKPCEKLAELYKKSGKTYTKVNEFAKIFNMCATSVHVDVETIWIIIYNKCLSA